MYRIDNSTAATTIDAPSAPGPQPNGYFTGGNPTGGVPATIVEAEWLNMQQEEISNVVLAAGLVLNKGDRTQLLQAIRGLGRMRLTAALDLYVSPSGSDTTGNGLTPGTAWATPQQAWGWINAFLDCAGQNVTVHIAPGTYPGMACIGVVPGDVGGIKFQGQVGNAGAVTLAGTNIPAVFLQRGAMLTVDSLTVTSSGSNSSIPNAGYGLVSGAASYLLFSNLIFGACGSSHMSAEAGATIQAEAGTYNITGSSPMHYNVTDNALINATGLSVTLTGTPSFATAFAFSSTNGMLSNRGCTFTGLATGQRWSVSNNAIIDINGAAPNTYYPGNANGVASNGGLVI